MVGGLILSLNFATEGLMQVLHEEYKDGSLRINCINPGGTRTSMRASELLSPMKMHKNLKRQKDLMPLYLYLMSDDSIGEYEWSIFRCTTRS